MEESFRRTIQLAIDGGLLGQNDICQQVLQLSKSCPLIFNSILKTATSNNDDDIDDFADSDEQDYSPVSLSSTVAPAKIMQDFGIPSRISTLPNMHQFLRQLREAYLKDYGKPSVTEPGSFVLKWYRKISFFK
jgi:hypothetical protein